MDTYPDNQVNREAPKKWYKKWWGIFLITFLFLIASLLTLFAVQVLSLSRQIKQMDDLTYGLTYTEPNPKAKIAAEDRISENVFGKEDAPVTIVEFGDFSCPICAAAHHNIRKAVLANPDKAKLVFRHFPVISENSVNLAMFAECAGEQGFFWQAHDRLFQNQGNINLGLTASQIGLDLEKIADCIESEKYLTAIKKDIADADYLEVAGTPTWFVNGYKLPGNISVQTWNKIINILSEKEKNKP